MSNTAIVLGAGNSTRMKSEKSKLLLEIQGKTVIERSVQTFLDCPDVDEVIVTVREQDIETFSSILTDSRVTFVIGGDTRQQSVKNAVDTVEDSDLIIIHDGARPLVTQQSLSDTIRAAEEYGAAAVGVKVKDTIKVVSGDLFITSTPDRDSLIAIQTPQIFNFEAYRNAIEKAQEENLDFTDDCCLIENAGGKVKVVPGDYENIKITTPDDILLAEKILSQRG